MNRKAVLLFSLALLCPAVRLYAARLASGAFTDIGGVFGCGSAAMISSNFEMSANVQELAVSTQEAAGFSQRSGNLSLHPFPAAVSDLSVVIVSSYGVRVTWTAPLSDAARPSPAADSYILRYTTSAPITSDGGFYGADTYAQAWPPLGPGAGETHIAEGFNAGTTYYFALESMNGHRLRSELSNPAAAFALPPLPPMNFKLVRSGNSVTMTWIHPAGYQNRIPFDNRFSPVYPYELKGYQIFRATAPVDAEWEFLTEVSSDTLTWTDNPGVQNDFYYHARAVNKAGLSLPSYARGSLSGSLYFFAPDNQSMLEIPPDGTGAFFSESADPMESYTIEIATHPEELGGRVVKAVEFSAYRGGMRPDASFKLSKNGLLKLYYRKSGNAIVPSELADAKALSMYYYNGARWLQMYGVVDAAERSVRLETTVLGRYQLRLTERSGGFTADGSGLTNRLITPNGDGKNDTMVFIFDNPQEKAVKGHIYDLRGALTAVMKPGPAGNSLIWDAKAGGRVVPGGVYIYQIEADGTVYNGTVAVIR